LLGGLYAIIGLGMSLIFGIMGLTNLAHGDWMIVAAYLTVTIAMQFTGSILLAILIAVACMVVLGFLSQTFLINKVLDKGAEPALLITFGISIILQNGLLKIFGANQMTIPTSFSASNIVSTPWFSISTVYMINFIVAVVVVLIIHLLMQKTYFGWSIRASSDDVTASELMGINTKRIYAYTMALAMITATIAGVLVGMTFNFYPSVGTQYLIIAFGVVVIGGMGSLVGTLVGGMVLGLAQMMGSLFFGQAYQLIFGYVVLLVILALRPQGLLSRKTRE
jgi:branched-chain amino acid transport system permease protein